MALLWVKPKFERNSYTLEVGERWWMAKNIHSDLLSLSEKWALQFFDTNTRTNSHFSSSWVKRISLHPLFWLPQNFSRSHAIQAELISFWRWATTLEARCDIRPNLIKRFSFAFPPIKKHNCVDVVWPDGDRVWVKRNTLNRRRERKRTSVSACARVHISYVDTKI